jgi:3-dehydroquinate synthase
MYPSELKWVLKLPDLGAETADSLLIFDKDLSRANSPFKKWSQDFGVLYPLASGDKLRDFEEIPRHVQKLLKLTQKLPKKRIVCVGGSSVTNFATFVASALGDGVTLTHIPSTWLAALDTCHGGRAALHSGERREAVTAFHPAHKVFHVWELLESQSSERNLAAVAELVKMALIDGHDWARDLLRESSADAQILLRRYLKEAVKAKYRLLARDPFETRGTRDIMNLGGTFAQLLESILGISHADAVVEGLHFAIEWSWSKDLIEDESFGDLVALVQDKLGFRWVVDDEARINKKQVEKILPQSFDFVFLKGFGKPVRMEVTSEDLIFEAELQGWLK